MPLAHGDRAAFVGIGEGKKTCAKPLQKHRYLYLSSPQGPDSHAVSRQKTTERLRLLPSEQMKSAALIAAALAYAANDVDAFFVPAGGLVNGASSTARVGQQGVSEGSSSRTAVSGALTHGTGCSCVSCNRSHGRSCGCPSCSTGVSARSHGAGCRCGACAVRMQAHPDGCGCGECSPAAPAAFKGSSCNCPDCGGCSKARGAPCMCSVCTTRPGRRGALATVMSMGAKGQVSAAGELRARLDEEPESVMFEDTMAAIADGFDYSPKR